ncbi:hypothetical protein VPH35_089334 [Triticum aestivum]
MPGFLSFFFFAWLATPAVAAASSHATVATVWADVAASTVVCATFAVSGVEVETSATRIFVATTETAWGRRTSLCSHLRICSPMCPPGFSPVRQHQGSRMTRRWPRRRRRFSARYTAGSYAPCISTTWTSGPSRSWRKPRHRCCHLRPRGRRGRRPRRAGLWLLQPRGY